MTRPDRDWITTTTRSNPASTALALLLICMSFGVLGCTESELGSATTAETCARTPKLIQHLDGGPTPTACLGDVVMVGLGADGAGELDVPLFVPEAVHVTFCVDTTLALVASVDLTDARGQQRLRALHGACAGADLESGTHHLKLTHAQRGQLDAPTALLFIHTPPVDPVDGAAAGTLLSTSVVINDSCPFCDLTNIDLRGVYFMCSDANIESSLGSTGYPESIGAGSCTIYYASATYHGGNNFSGALFGGAKLDGTFFLKVYFRNAQFYDPDYGPATLGLATDVFDQPNQAVSFDYCDIRGASFQHATLNVPLPVDASLRSPFFNNSNVAGADFRYANLSGADFSSFKYSNGAPPNEGPSKLAGIKLNSDTNIRGANFSKADASGLDWHLTDWSETRMQNTNLTGGNMSGFDFAAAPYAGKFFLADKSADYLAGANLTGVNFSGANVAGLDLTHALLTTTNFTNANLHGAHLAGANFTKANLTNADLGAVTATEASPAIFNGAQMKYAFLQQASLPGSFFRGVVMDPANLGSANLSGTYFEVDQLCFDTAGNCLVSNPSCVCQAATLSGSFMHNTILSGAHMTDTVLDYVSWYNDTPTSVVATGAGAFLTGASFNLADLPGLDLTGAFLQGAVLTNSQLIGANLTGARLGRDGSTRTNLSTANLRGANLSNADLSYANLQNAGVDPAPESEVYLEVLKDPGHYTTAEVYQYFAVNRPATVLGANSTVTAVTDFATCPSGGTGPCGPITSPSWIAPTPPAEPTDCMPTKYDSEGNVIEVTCTSSRHPT